MHQILHIVSGKRIDKMRLWSVCMLVLLVVLMETMEAKKKKKPPPPSKGGGGKGGFVSWLEWLEAYQFVCRFVVLFLYKIVIFIMLMGSSVKKFPWIC